MATITIEDRIATIRGPGVVVVGSDLHGNVEDLRRLVAHFEAEPDACLLLLGDLFHGPEIHGLLWAMDYGHLGEHYEDASDVLFREVAALMDDHPDRVASLIGNHDHAHVGGPVVSKFFDDEARHTEDKLAAEEVEALKAMVRRLPFLAVSEAGVAFTHAAPPERPFTRQTILDVDLAAYRDLPLNAMYRVDWFGELLWRRGSSPDGPDRFLNHLAQVVPDLSCDVVVHGHEIARDGWAMDHRRVLNLSTSFGMERERKTYLRLDLGETYREAAELRPGVELLPLW